MIGKYMVNMKISKARIAFMGACEALSRRDRTAYLIEANRLSGMTSAYLGVCPELHRYCDWLETLLVRFGIQTDTSDFNAWAMGEAFKGIKGIVESSESSVSESHLDEVYADNVRLADEYLAERPHLSGGAVIIYCGAVCGWTRSFHEDPSKFRPGCVAVSADPGRPQYRSIGGDDYNGACQWIRCHSGQEVAA